MIKIFLGNFEETAQMIFSIYDFDKDGVIRKSDVKLLLSYLPIKSKDETNHKHQMESLEELDEILLETFGNKETLQLEEFLKFLEQFKDDEGGKSEADADKEEGEDKEGEGKEGEDKEGEGEEGEGSNSSESMYPIMIKVLKSLASVLSGISTKAKPRLLPVSLSSTTLADFIVPNFSKISTNSASSKS